MIILSWLFFAVKTYTLIGLSIAAWHAWREISVMHNARLDPYGTSKFQAWMTSLRNVYWIVLPFYIFFYLIFWPWSLLGSRHGK